jgi:serine-type D-Ala-D-Ala carboxypeptidase/endopeptidase
MFSRGLLLLTCIALSAAAADDTRAILASRVETSKVVGIVAATIDGNAGHGREVISYGTVSKDAKEIPNADTIFEIGSITKVFTSLLLADMVERGEVTVDTPVKNLLPESVNLPSRNGRQITLLDLSMQVSGLPRLPENMKPADADNPYADYDPPKLYEFLSGYKLTRDPGEKYEYSNLGAGLLGHALARKAGLSYEELLRRRILEPLAMSSTSITLSDSQRKRLAPGYDAGLKPVKNWDLDALAGAGAIRSTANDLLKFLAANLELTDTPLKPAMRRMRSVRRETGIPDLDIAMAWHVLKKYDTEIFWHNGGTAGYRTFIGFDPAKKKGSLVLANTAFDIDDIGRHLIEASYPVATLSPPKERKQIALAPEILERYTGEYQLTPSFSIRVTREEGRLFAQATGQSRFELYSETETEFFLKVVDAQVTFGKDESGKVTHLVLHQSGHDVKGVKNP